DVVEDLLREVIASLPDDPNIRKGVATGLYNTYFVPTASIEQAVVNLFRYLAHTVLSFDLMLPSGTLAFDYLEECRTSMRGVALRAPARPGVLATYLRANPVRI